jgi:hypothetical protein
VRDCVTVFLRSDRPIQDEEELAWIAGRKREISRNPSGAFDLQTAIERIVNAQRAEGLAAYQPSPKGWALINRAIEG